MSYNILYRIKNYGRITMNKPINNNQTLAGNHRLFNSALLFLLLLNTFFLLSSPTLANDGETQVSISISENLATIGDHINIKIIVKTSADIDEIVIKVPEQREYEILSPMDAPSHKRKQTDYTVLERNLTATFFKTGDFDIGPFSIDLMKNKDVVENKITNSVPVTVKTVLNDDDKDIKDLKNPIDIKGNPFYILKYVIIAVAVLLLISTLIWWLKARKKEKPIQDFTLPPIEELEKHVNDLWRKRLYEKGNLKLHFLELTVIIKHFLNRYYHFNAEDFTSYETLYYLKQHESDSTPLNNLQFVFNTSDLVKFAKFVPDTSVFNEVLEKLNAMIHAYKQRELARASQEPQEPQTQPTQPNQPDQNQLNFQQKGEEQ
jgi:hypothetical protein